MQKTRQHHGSIQTRALHERASCHHADVSAYLLLYTEAKGGSCLLPVEPHGGIEHPHALLNAPVAWTHAFLHHVTVECHAQQLACRPRYVYTRTYRQLHRHSLGIGQLRITQAKS
eukprot:18548-Eustigmatos_ZCMA.PRE.1